MYVISSALSSAARTPTSPPILTTDVHNHLSHLLGEYHDLQEQAHSNTTVRDHTLYQKMSYLEPVVKLMTRLDAKEKVLTTDPNLPYKSHLPSLQEVAELQELLEGCTEEGGMKTLAREEQKSCYQEIQCIQVNL